MSSKILGLMSTRTNTNHLIDGLVLVVCQRARPSLISLGEIVLQPGRRPQGFAPLNQQWELHHAVLFGQGFAPLNQQWELHHAVLLGQGVAPLYQQGELRA